MSNKLSKQTFENSQKWHKSQAHLAPQETFKMKLFVKIMELLKIINF